MLLGEEDFGYDDMVDSMMQAWNGGIPVSAPKSIPHTSDEREEKQDSQRRVFSVPDKKTRERGRKTRPEVRLSSC